MEKTLKYIIWAGLAAVSLIPLLVKSNYYFPYIVPKTLAFRIIIEVIFLAYLGLAVIKKEYRPKLNLVLVLFFLYLISIFLSSILGGSFYFSFWSNNERSEGLLLLLHLFLFLIVLSAFLKDFKEWLLVFEASFLGGLLVSLVALAQYLNVSWILESSGGTRLTSTIGNAGYVGGYLLFNVFFGLILFFQRKDNGYLRFYYLSVILLQLFVILNTQTRGAILSVGLSAFALIIYLSFFYLKGYRSAKISGIVLPLLMIILVVLIFADKTAPWVRKNPVFSRISAISVSSTTAQNRLMTWQASYLGFKEKPILGYGYENFYQVFDKYFPPRIYEDAGSIVWYDRAHNMIFDRLITGGLAGLILYLSFLLAPIFYLWRYFVKKKQDGQYLIPVIATLLMAAYFIQNLFIFEALVTYIPLFLSLGFLSRFCPAWPNKFLSSNKPHIVLLTVGLILFLPVLFIVNIKPASANKTLIRAMMNQNVKDYKESYKYFIEAVDKNTFGNQEYRQHFGEFIAGAVEISGIDANWLSQSALRAEQEFDKQITERPKSARNYLMVMRFLNKTYGLNLDRLNKSLELFKKVSQVSPTRPHIYYEAGYSQFYLGRVFEGKGDKEKAKKYYEESLANFQKAIDLNDRVVESYTNMIMVLLAVQKSDKVQSYFDRMDEMGLNYHREDDLSRMGNSAIKAENFEWTLKFYQELTRLFPEKPDYWINLALSYAFLGDKDKAVETAQKIKSFEGDYVKQADAFIQDVSAGKFKR